MSTALQNNLAHETSPYLIQHAGNPVHWQPWGEGALALARARNKPILLSVGYAACHWCHVMAHESFENPDIAAVMNELFINIKVDREERPDIDQIYMTALHALGEQGGWPLTMFLTPGGEPFWGGTYYPPESRYGRPGFVDVLRAIAKAYHTDFERVGRNRQALLDVLSRIPQRGDRAFGADGLAQAITALAGITDPVNGGTKGAPKFPNASYLELLWRGGPNSEARKLMLLTLERICQGGIRDHIGGGFARYSVDEVWLVPHFEKMLYDNAQLLELLALAWQETRRDLFRQAATEMVEWLQREMMAGEGRTLDGQTLNGSAFAASLDADSEGHEGRFYVWKPHELAEILGVDDAEFVAHTFDIADGGNWEGQSIPNRLGKPDLEPALEIGWQDLRPRLISERAKRIAPARDDKVLADWNGLAIAALARASLVFDKPEWLDLARAAFRFVAESMADGPRLGHSWRDGRLLRPGLATDLAAMIRAALALHEAGVGQSYLDRALGWAEAIERDYLDVEGGGYFLTAKDAAALITRPRSTLDDAVPNANGIMADNLVRLAAVTGEERWLRRGDELLTALSPAMAGNVFGHASLLNALDLRLHGLEIVVIGSGEEADRLTRAALDQPYPNRTILRAAVPGELPAGHAVHQANAGDEPAVFVCSGQRCSLPVRDEKALIVTMASMRG
ncbi:thioredoxin domain-containing protein [Labrys sp. KNU-23]|uniref:thioredoxin domain-containing protein n=1 Tax=Labrys sp. KNU-23 TaxID=2789216 RepID=UPI0011EE5E9C|nr:thioredoxin domain-containing protein [Labrys sp. KNU-23]QEN88701.1 thioredoxin domain-containing protein [Labrys sp. KNU-23]